MKQTSAKYRTHSKLWGTRTSIVLVVSILFSCGQNERELKQGQMISANREYKALFQQAIDYSGLQGYLYPDEPDRRILCVAGDMLPEGLELWKNKQRVKVITPPDTCDNCIYFVYTRTSHDSAFVRFRYPIESFFATLVYIADSSGWRLVDSMSGVN